ncbi:hypothetical protein BGO17_00280 [Candidatus Saccharibacteria bacterium 49-20]|nr:MAG: hypothetical protein BGO17_00280 [Candidatus Saccharibacteria bacterium 49-20]
MFLVGLISWWYGRGWVGQWRRVAHRFALTLEFFSVGQLLSTLFSPFRQISANGGSDGSIGSELRAFIDQLISRIIGAFVRFFTILFGIVVIILQAVYETVIMVAWWFLPLLPVAGFIMLAIGWVPTWM